jgi:hypothetical protein
MKGCFSEWTGLLLLSAVVIIIVLALSGCSTSRQHTTTSPAAQHPHMTTAPSANAVPVTPHIERNFKYNADEPANIAAPGPDAYLTCKGMVKSVSKDSITLVGGSCAGHTLAVAWGASLPQVSIGSAVEVGVMPRATDPWTLVSLVNR